MKMKPSYYPITKQWKKLKPIYETPFVIYQSWLDMEVFQHERANEFEFPFKSRDFTRKHRPSNYDGRDWRWGKVGRPPAWWDWVCAGACHWVVNTNLTVIRRLEPEHPWQIVTSDKHSTVVDLERKMFYDTNWLACGVTAQECWKDTISHKSMELLEPGQLLELAQPFDDIDLEEGEILDAVPA